MIGFVRYRSVTRTFESKGPFEVNKNTVAKLIEAIVGLRRRALSPEDLLKDFGPESPVTRTAIKTFYGKLLNPSDRTKTFFEDWRRVFSQVCAYSPSKVKGLEKFYGLKGVDPEKLLFAVHTYYALIMKLLAAEVGSLYITPRIWSYLRTLEDAYYRGHERLRDELRDLEEGGIFQKLGILNFLEADYFAWYLDEWDPEVGKAIMNVIDRLVEYDPSVADLEPERIRDLFKRLYQNLVPKKIRHDLGEYYTPDWLAELVLKEVGWTLENFEKVAEEKGDVLAPLDLRLLDPACGSGTFLILAINRLKDYIEEHWIDKGTALKKITRNIVGFDLNPLAVIASRTNYLIALGDMLREKGVEPIEIPVYLTDSILVERRQTLAGSTFVLRTVAGEFIIPVGIVERGLLSKVLSIVEECVREKYKQSEFKARLLKEVSLKEAESSIISELFEVLSKLEKKGKNRIWTRILKNSFAPFFVGKFDYIVGNPPWINWESLPEEYKQVCKGVWSGYELFPFKGWKGKLGFAKYDVSMVFVYVSIDRYLKDRGNLGFLITQSVFQSDAGYGFRKFYYYDANGEKRCMKVYRVHDLVEIQPFEGASNRTSMILIKKGEETSYPVEYILWKKKEKVDPFATLNEVLKKVKVIKLCAYPVLSKDPQSRWLITKGESSLKIISKIVGKSIYKGFAGSYTEGANGVFWMRILNKLPKGELLIRNVTAGVRERVEEVVARIEQEFVYPLLRGKDVKKWRATPSMYILFTSKHFKDLLQESKFKVNYPKTYSYLLRFKRILERRSSYRHKMMSQGYPFYTIYGSKAMLARYKVVWQRMGTKLEAAVIGEKQDKFLGKRPVIPQETIIFIPTQNEAEAHFICAILNSTLSAFVLQSYSTRGGKGFASAHVLNHIKIPKFDINNKLHNELSKLSKEAHKLVVKNAEEKLAKIEMAIDKTVAELYGITEDELREIRKCLAILKGEDVEEEEKGVEIRELAPELIVETPVLYVDKGQELEIKIINHYDAPIRDVKVKLVFEGRSSEKVFDEISDEMRVAFRLSGLKGGEYWATFSMEYLWEVSMGSVEKVVPIYVKRSSESKVRRSSLDEL